MGIPDEFENVTRIDAVMDAMERENALAILDSAEIGIESSFLWNKKNRNLLLYPEVTIDHKKGKGVKDFPTEAQTWVISKV